MPHPKTKPAAKASRKPQQSDIPDWLTDTPNTGYELTLWVESSDEQTIELTREEFIALKAHLAELRGLKVKSAA